VHVKWNTTASHTLRASITEVLHDLNNDCSRWCWKSLVTLQGIRFLNQMWDHIIVVSALWWRLWSHFGFEHATWLTQLAHSTMRTGSTCVIHPFEVVMPWVTLRTGRFRLLNIVFSVLPLNDDLYKSLKFHSASFCYKILYHVYLSVFRSVIFIYLDCNINRNNLIYWS
jgi:hypothetical protein